MTAQGESGRDRRAFEERVRALVAVLPPRMLRDDLLAWLRERLPPTLGLRPSEVRIEWQLDRLDVVIPTRAQYLGIEDVIIQVIEEAVARVDIADAQQLTDEQFRERARGLRGA